MNKGSEDLPLALFKNPSSRRMGFTLLELLIVIGILAILAVAAFFVLNPGEYVKQARDAKRLSDVSATNRALALTGLEKIGLGNVNTVYVSIPDPSLSGNATSTCPNMGLAALPSGLSYQCVSSTNLRKTDGTGWVPVDFTAVSNVSRVTALPVDPVNATSTNLYYTYAISPSTMLGQITTQQMESVKYFGLSSSGTSAPLCGTYTVPYGGQDYSTVLIGSQCWFAQNLNVGTYIASTDTQTNNGIVEKYCFNDIEANCTTDGGFYQWDEAMAYTTTAGVQGICPVNWHMPTDAEYKTLEIQLGMTQVQADTFGVRGTDQGTKLKQGGSSGFNALLVGYHYSVGTFYSYGAITKFWSSSESNAVNAWFRKLQGVVAGVERNDTSKAYGSSVRCLRN